MMLDRKKVIKHFEHLLNAAKGNYQDFVDLTVDVGEEILALLKEQESIIKTLKSDLQETLDIVANRGNVVRCKDCKKHNTWECWQYFFGRMNLPDDYYCADGELKEGVHE